MNSNKVTAIATSVIAISIIGFIGFEIYNDPKNVEARCEATYEREVKKGIPEWKKEFYEKNPKYKPAPGERERILYRLLQKCLREARRS
tara:strand:- start:842 stop:1108 length:267 start_codon:yes stop_codon:yes gene_type:complete